MAIPSGDQATLADMLAAQISVKELIAEMEEYLACMDAEIGALGEEATEEARTLLVEQYNSGLDRMEEVAAEFNEQLQLFQEAASTEN